MPPSGVGAMPDGDAFAAYQAYGFKDNDDLKDGQNT
jgi:hypothetical protein